MIVYVCKGVSPEQASRRRLASVSGASREALKKLNATRSDYACRRSSRTNAREQQITVTRLIRREPFDAVWPRHAHLETGLQP